jgi:endonuclease YncB( thermonuclease family)
MQRFAPLFLLVLLIAVDAAAATLEGRVVRVVDGDTVAVLDAARTQHKVRLATIDAPESGQPFGRRAKEHLAELVAGQAVSVDWHKRDRYGRLIGRLLHDGLDVNLRMVRDGYAWWYRQYANEQSRDDRRRYEDAEAAARTEGVGLWRDREPVPPWEWRTRDKPGLGSPLNRTNPR